MAKVIIKSEKITAFGGIFFVLDKFDSILSSVIDSHLGLRSTLTGYQYSEIVGSLSSVYSCGGDCVEDVTSHLMPHLSLHPTLRTCSSDTILRGISELATANTAYFFYIFPYFYLFFFRHAKRKTLQEVEYDLILKDFSVYNKYGITMTIMRLDKKVRGA